MPGPRLESERLALRPLAPDDLAAVHRHWTDPGVRRYLWDDVTISEQRASVELHRSIADFESRGYGLWGVRPRGGESPQRELIGVAGLRPIDGGDEVEVLFSLDPALWSRGLATEVAAAVVDWGFREAGLERVVGRCDAPNDASRRVLEKLGMRFVRRAPIHGLDSLHYVLERGEGGR